MPKLHAAISSIILGFGAFASSAASAAEERLPVTRVVLFSSGVAYVEHAGTVTGDATTELRFRTGQLNDVLKSLVLEDQGGGRIGTIAYPSQNPLDKTLASFQVNLAGNPSLAQLLTQLRGSQVTVRWQSESVTGSILGIETRQRPVGDKGQIAVPVLSLLSGSMIRQFPLEELNALTLEDPRLQEELTKALTSVATARDQDTKPVTLRFTGAGARPVRVGYVVEAPLWKVSYRLMMPAKDGDKVKLQGWAIVENQTDSDWNGIELALVSGRPLGFVQDLASPRYLPRPVVQDAAAAVLAPQAFGGGQAPAAPLAMMKSRGMAREAEVAAAPAAAMAAPAMDFTASVVSQVSETANQGALFRYSVPGVSLARQRSAMLPIITDPMTGEAVSVYRVDALADHPLAGVWLTNDTGKSLLAGPVTAFADGGYAGDARIDHLAPGDRRLLTFAVDLPVQVQVEHRDETRTIRNGRIVDGVLMMKTSLEATTTYRATTSDDRARILVVEHQRRPEWTLVKTPAPVESTPALHRFRLAVPVGAQGGTLSVTETITTEESVAIVDVDAHLAEIYANTSELSAPIRQELAKIAATKSRLAQVERQEELRRQEIANIVADQNRLRENMKTVAQSSPYYQRLLGKLNDQETKVEGLQSDLDKLSNEAQEIRGQLVQQIKGLNLL